MKILIAILSCVILVGCSTFDKPNVTAGYYIANSPESKATIVLGSNNTQANAIHSDLPATDGKTEGEADLKEGTHRASGLFVNNTSGNRSADVDATTALEMLRNVQSSTAGQNNARDQSPNSGTQTPTTTDTHEKTNTIPVSVGK